MTKIIVKLDKVWKIYQMGSVDVPALQGLSIEVHLNEFLIVMGPSGSGKSTAVNMLGCLDLPTRGKVFLKGEDITTLSESDLSQIRGKTLGFVFQQFNLIRSMSAIENVMLPMIFQGVPGEERARRAIQLLKSMGLAERANHRPTEMSGGEQQRVAIARALANNPEVIIADEPTGNLDSRTGAQVLQILSELHKKGKTIVMVTHDPRMKSFGTRILMLKDGKVEGEIINKKATDKR